MAKTRPCKASPACAYAALKGRQSCGWHWLAKQPIAVQLVHADARREAWTAEREHLPRVPKQSWPPGLRWCSGCQTMVPLWYASGSRCKACTSRANHGGMIEKTYGITGDEYERLLKFQGGRCAICRCIPRTVRLAVDHDHETGQVRGLCCSRCNHDLLGAARDEVDILRRAVAYLECPPARALALG